MTKTKKKVIILLLITILIVLVPLFILKGAEFGGSDDAGSQVISEITGEEYEPWFTPVMERWIGGEIPGETESLLFCVQTAIGVGIIAFFMGRFVERTKKEKLESNKIG
ncbi:energy-coupling factor ABC transporter substrate-binding protein [Clostridium intestinale]|jgi:cobalt/nickel transport protein|uniref:Cobalt transport protein CbiN n=2 Tax=Clostridium intestinale TaxID=36845 RepID=U2NSA8_9CLOT|nr:cobalt transport protein CbiN [Clostridium intestinale]ERK31746.1 cobalt transport protein CbiN [Clostridium intestinale URNW]QLY78821.1 cobalt transport protein CbiN [Clostridium intestinale]